MRRICFIIMLFLCFVLQGCEKADYQEYETDAAVILDKDVSEEPYISPLDQTRIKTGSKKQNNEKNLQITEESNSEKWNTEECQKIIHDKEEAFGCDFTLATSEFEGKIQGIWQAKEFVGWDDSSRYQWDGENTLFILSDDVIIMERNGSYWELEKVGDIEMSDTFSNVSDTQ